MGLVLGAIGIASGVLLHSPLLSVVLGGGALFAPGWLRRRRQTAWRRQVRSELGDAVEYLEVHFAAGATVLDAITGTAAFLVGPLAAELRRVLARAALLQDGSRALDGFAARLSDPDPTAVARRLSAAWRLRAPGPDTFAGFGDTLRHLRETHIVARTKTLPVVYVAIVGWMIFALVAIIVVPVGTQPCCIPSPAPEPPTPLAQGRRSPWHRQHRWPASLCPAAGTRRTATPHHDGREVHTAWQPACARGS